MLALLPPWLVDLVRDRSYRGVGRGVKEMVGGKVGRGEKAEDGRENQRVAAGRLETG